MHDVTYTTFRGFVDRISASCPECPWSMTLPFSDEDYGQVLATLQVAGTGHSGLKPNAGHPFFRDFPKYRMKEPEYEARQWTGENDEEMRDFAGWWIENETLTTGSRMTGRPGYPVLVAKTGDWIVKDGRGNLHIVDGDQFHDLFFQVPRAFKYPVC